MTYLSIKKKIWTISKTCWFSKTLRTAETKAHIMEQSRRERGSTGRRDAQSTEPREMDQVT